MALTFGAHLRTQETLEAVRSRINDLSPRDFDIAMVNMLAEVSRHDTISHFPTGGQTPNSMMLQALSERMARDLGIELPVFRN